MTFFSPPISHFLFPTNVDKSRCQISKEDLLREGRVRAQTEMLGEEDWLTAFSSEDQDRLLVLEDGGEKVHVFGVVPKRFRHTIDCKKRVRGAQQPNPTGLFCGEGGGSRKV